MIKDNRFDSQTQMSKNIYQQQHLYLQEIFIYNNVKNKNSKISIQILDGQRSQSQKYQSKIAKLLLFLLIFQLQIISTCSELTFSEQILQSSSNNFTLFNKLKSIQVQQTHILGTQFISDTPTSNPLKLRAYTRNSSTNQWNQYSFDLAINPSLYFIRSHATNSFTSSTSFSGRLLVMENNRTLKIAENSTANMVTIHDTSSTDLNPTLLGDELIFDACFGYSTNQVLLLLSSSDHHILLFLQLSPTNPSSIISQNYTFLPSLLDKGPSVHYVDMKYNRYNNIVFIMFNRGVFGYTSDMKLQKRGQYLTNSNQSNYNNVLCVGKHPDYLAFAYRDNLYIYNITTYLTQNKWILILSRSLQSQVSGLSLFPPYIFIGRYSFFNVNSTLSIGYTSIYQVQIYCNSALNNSLNYSTYFGQSLIQWHQTDDFIQFVFQVDIFENDQIVIYQTYQYNGIAAYNFTTNDYMRFYKFTDGYISWNNSCMSGYVGVMNGSLYCKRANMIVPSSKIYLPYKNVETNENSQSSYLFPMLNYLNQSQTLRRTTQSMASALKYTSMRITPQFMMSLIIFLDDLWYYKYHRMNYCGEARFFMNKADIMNEIRYLKRSRSFASNQSSPNSVDLLYGVIDVPSSVNWPSFGFGYRENALYSEYLFQDYQYSQEGGENPDQVYFLNSTQQIYINVVLLNVLMFVGLKVVTRILCLISRHMALLQSIAHSFQNQTHWWSLVVSILQTNMMRLSFSCFVQLAIPSYFCFENKLNFICTVCTLFSLFIYCLTSYCLIYQVEISRAVQANKKLEEMGVQSSTQKTFFVSSQILLTRSNNRIHSISPYIYESISIVTRNLFRSFVHAYLFSHYSAQIILLFLSDAFFVALTIRFKGYHKNAAIFLLVLTYHSLFAIFDGFFILVSYLGPNQQNGNWFFSTQPLFSTIVLFSLIATSVMTCVAMTVFWILECFRQIKKSFGKKSMIIASENIVMPIFHQTMQSGNQRKHLKKISKFEGNKDFISEERVIKIANYWSKSINAVHNHNNEKDRKYVETSQTVGNLQLSSKQNACKKQENSTLNKRAQSQYRLKNNRQKTCPKSKLRQEIQKQQRTNRGKRGQQSNFKTIKELSRNNIQILDL